MNKLAALVGLVMIAITATTATVAAVNPAARFTLVLITIVLVVAVVAALDWGKHIITLANRLNDKVWEIEERGWEAKLSGDKVSAFVLWYASRALYYVQVPLQKVDNGGTTSYDF